MSMDHRAKATVLMRSLPRRPVSRETRGYQKGPSSIENSISRNARRDRRSETSSPLIIAKERISNQAQWQPAMPFPRQSGQCVDDCR
jgi:hypothetical protein